MKMKLYRRALFFIGLFILYFYFCHYQILPNIVLWVEQYLNYNQLLGFHLVVNQLILFVPPIVIYCLATKQKLTEVAHFKSINITNISLVIIICIVVQPFLMLISYTTSLFFKNNTIENFIQLREVHLYVRVVGIAIYPAIFEEIMFRGIILNDQYNTKLKYDMILNGVIFAILHFDYQKIPYAFLLGAMFVIFVRYTGSIVASMIGHFVFNFVQLLLSEISFGYYMDFDSLIILSVFAAISLIITIYLLKIFMKRNRGNLTKYNEFEEIPSNS